LLQPIVNRACIRQVFACVYLTVEYKHILINMTRFVGI
jgi:hypothetical protein